MFCIRSDVITLTSIKMYESHDMRHTGFRRMTVVNGTLGFLGCYNFSLDELQFLNISQGWQLVETC